MEPPIFYSGQPHFHSSPSSLFTHWPPKASKAKIPSLAPKHYWTCKGAPTSIESGLDSHMGALERATVRSRTVAAPFQAPPATSGLPSVPDETPRRPVQGSWSAPSSLSLSCPCSHAHRPPESSSERAHMRDVSDPSPLPLFLPLALDQPHKHPRHGASSPRALWRRTEARRCTGPRHLAVRLFKGLPEPLPHHHSLLTPPSPSPSDRKSVV